MEDVKKIVESLPSVHKSIMEAFIEEIETAKTRDEKYDLFTFLRGYTTALMYQGIVSVSDYLKVYEVEL